MIINYGKNISVCNNYEQYELVFNLTVNNKNIICTVHTMLILNIQFRTVKYYVIFYFVKYYSFKWNQLQKKK